MIDLFAGMDSQQWQEMQIAMFTALCSHDDSAIVLLQAQ